MTDLAKPDLPTDTVTLPSGGLMPLIGFGTWQIKGDEAVAATAAALEAGYRHLDTATVYGNEAQVGHALRDSGVAREEVFVTTKCLRTWRDRSSTPCDRASTCWAPTTSTSG